MGIQTQFNKFHDNIKLTREDDAYKRARDRDDSITKAIKESFKKEGYSVTSDFIQGSFAMGTAINPLSGDHDIDRALVIDEEPAPTNPVTPKKTALKVLEERGFKNARIKMPCVTADYASDNVHIDFPIYKSTSTEHYLAEGKANSDEVHRKWSISDPKGLVDWVTDSRLYGDAADKKQFQYRRLVRYMKRWRDHKFSANVCEKIYSIGLTVMMKQSFVISINQDGFADDLSSLRCTIEKILIAGYFRNMGNDRYKVSVPLPVAPWTDIFSGSSEDTGTQFRNKLVNMKDKLIEAEGLENVREQSKILNNLFGDDFEIPNPPSGSKKKSRAVYPTAGAVGTSQGA